MRFCWTKMALGALLATIVAAPLRVAVAQASPEVKVDLNLKDADLVTATNVLFAKAGLQFLFEPGQEPFKKITLKIDGVTAEEAVSYICQAAGVYFRRDEAGVYIISRTKPTADPVASTPVRVARRTAKIKLQKSDAKAVYDMVMYSIPMSSTKGFEDLKRFQNLNTQESQRIFGPQVGYHSSMGPAQTFGPTGQPVNNPLPTPADSGAANNIKLPGDDAASQVGGGGFGGRGFGGGAGGGIGGQGGGIGGQGGGIGGQGGGIGGQGGGQLVGGQGLVGSSIDFISYDPNDNSLVVRGNEDDINELQSNIALFDVAPRQVQVKVEFLTTTDQLDRSFGTEFLYQRGTVFLGTRPGSFIRTSDPVFLNYATGNVTSRLRASLFQGTGRVVSAPILRTLNNQPAFISSSIQTTIFINQTQVTQGAIVTFANPLPLSANTFLTIAPRINDDGTITMWLSPSIQNFVGSSRGPNGEQIPNIAVQSIGVVARVRNGETMVMGGLTQKNDDIGQTRVPVLSELPIIGQFFRFGTRSRTVSELLIFVTPTVIEDDLGTGINP